jgi:mRNA interferase MazF
MERGEVWWAWIDERRPVVLLSGGNAPELRAMQIVAPATAQQKRGFAVLSGAEASDPDEMGRIISAAGPAIGGIGVEVKIGRDEGLSPDGVVRVALPREGTVFCTWLVTLAPECLIERVGALSPATLKQLDGALRLAAIE